MWNMSSGFGGLVWQWKMLVCIFFFYYFQTCLKQNWEIISRFLDHENNWWLQPQIQYIHAYCVCEWGTSGVSRNIDVFALSTPSPHLLYYCIMCRILLSVWICGRVVVILDFVHWINSSEVSAYYSFGSLHWEQPETEKIKEWLLLLEDVYHQSQLGQLKRLSVWQSGKLSHVALSQSQIWLS